MKYFSRYPITCAEMDAQYRLTVDGVMTFHEDAVAKYLTTLNLAAFDLQRNFGNTWVITEINMDLKETPALWAQDVEVAVWPSEVSAFRVWFEFEARVASRESTTEGQGGQGSRGGRVMARGNSCWSTISVAERKVVPCGDLLPAEEVVAELAAGPHRKRGLAQRSGQPTASFGHTVNLMDLDMNGHTNNRRYVAMALSCFDKKFLTGNRPDSLNIRFVKESRLGDALTVASYPLEDGETNKENLQKSAGQATFLGQVTNAAGDEICRVCSHWTPKEPAHDMPVNNPVRNP